MYGSHVFCCGRYFFRNHLASHRRNRHSLEGSDMTLFYIIGLIIAAGLVVYLFIALLRPELFS
ncbi:MAG: K(+)-transporting ATPase subunit F [Syntrophales bacterium]